MRSDRRGFRNAPKSDDQLILSILKCDLDGSQRARLCHMYKCLITKRLKCRDILDRLG
jgi:hypothetical protein